MTLIWVTFACYIYYDYAVAHERLVFEFNKALSNVAHVYDDRFVRKDVFNISDYYMPTPPPQTGVQTAP
jgi:hypothetical protein